MPIATKTARTAAARSLDFTHGPRPAGRLLATRRRLVPAVLRRADEGPAAGLAADRGGTPLAGPRADRVGQDAGRLPRRDRRLRPRPRRARHPGGLRLAAQGA